MTARPMRDLPMRLVRDEPLTAASELARGQEAERAGRRTEARGHFERALSLLTSGDDPATAALLMRRIAITYHVDLDLDAAEDCAHAALAVSTAHGDEGGVGHATNILAILEWRRGNVDEAERLYLAARSSARKSGDVRLAAMIAQNLGIMASMAGDLRAALRHYHSSLADYRSLGLSSEMLRALNNLGILYTDLERWDAAQRSFAEAVEIGTLTGELSALVTVHLGVAALWIARGDFDRAQQAAAHADELVTRLDDHHADGERARIAGILARERTAFSEGDQHFRRAIEVAVSHGDVLLEAEAARELAELCRRQGRNRDALAWLARSHRLFSHLRARRDVADIERRNARLEAELFEVVRKWGESIEAKDIYTQGHCERVSELACALATRAGLPRESMFWFRIGAILHDVGKLVVPSEILNKPGPLTAAEWAVVRSHPTAGVALLSEVDFPGDVVPIVRGHHEQWAGGGYPDGLAGYEIPLSARIVCIADVYDALTSERAYQTPYTHLEAMEIMRREVGRRFDPQLFALFESLMSEGVHVRTVTPRHTPSRPMTRVTETDEMDDLTGVLTRRSFVEEVTTSLESRGATSCAALLVLDVDLFKRVNDVFGHLQGDDVLRGLAEVLRATVDASGSVGRFAGDEFVIWLPHADEAQAEGVAEAIRAAVQHARMPRVDGQGTIAVSVSVGIATSPESGRSFEELFAAADRAMYDAKRMGRNRVGTFVTPVHTQEPPLSAERFVGRGRELEQLTTLLEESLRRRAQLVLVSGDAGVGKSTLLRQLATDVRLRGGLFVCGQCFESDLRPPYSPWVEVLTSIVGTDLLPARAWQELPRLVPALGSPAIVTPPSKYALYEEVTEALRLACSAQPITLVLEDMQWADSSAWDLLEHVQSRVANERLLICLTVRDDPARALDPERRIRLSRDERVRPIHLGPLSQGEIRLWLESVLDRRDIAPELLSLVCGRTEGNPLLVNQVLRAMLDAHALWHDGARWQWHITDDLRLPASAYDLFARRIDRLAPLSRRILSVAAVVGRRFDVDLLVGAGAGNEDDVLEAIDDAIRAGVIQAGDGEDEDQFAFCHALLHDALRLGINPVRARRIHGRVAEALERREPRSAARLAEHFDRAGLSARAYEYAIRAGAEASDLHAPDDAIAFFGTAARHARTTAERLQAYAALIDVTERMASYERCEAYCREALARIGTELDATDRLWLDVQLARVRFQTGATPEETLTACERLMATAVSLGRADERTAIAILQSHACSRAGDVVGAERAASDAVASTDQLGAPATRVTALLRFGTVVLERASDEALTIFQRALDLAQATGDAYTEARCHVAVGVACARSERNDEASAAYDTAARIARRIHAPDLAGLAALNLGVLRLHAGEFADAREQLSIAVNQFTLVTNEAHRLVAMYNAASVERECGNAAAAADLYRRTHDLAEALGFRDIALGAAAGAGLAAIRLGRAELAARTAAELRAEMAREGERWFQGREMVEALLLRVSLESGDLGASTEQFWSAASSAERNDPYGAAWFVAEVVTDLVAAGYSEAWRAARRFAPGVAKLGYAPLAARYHVLDDLATREPDLIRG